MFGTRSLSGGFSPFSIFANGARTRSPISAPQREPGAATNIFVNAVVNSPPEGYTLLFVAASAAVNVSLFDSLPFNLLRDIGPVSGLIDFLS